MFSLYQAVMPGYQQILGSMAGLLETAETYCNEQGLAPAELIQARLAADMLPFAYQVKSTAVHSLGAIEGVRKGIFSPNRSTPPDSFAGLKAHIAETRSALDAVRPAEVEAWIGRDMAFVFGERRMDFVAEDFLLSFSQVNFYFHASTAYDILRWKGLPIGKRDFTGQLRTKPRP